MIKDPRTKEFCENGDTFNGWIGPDVHFLFSTIKNGSDCCWVLTHRVCSFFILFVKWLELKWNAGRGRYRRVMVIPWKIGRYIQSPWRMGSNMQGNRGEDTIFGRLEAGIQRSSAAVGQWQGTHHTFGWLCPPIPANISPGSYTSNGRRSRDSGLLEKGARQGPNSCCCASVSGY